MTARILNARMYAVTPGIEETWRHLLERITGEAGVSLDYVRYPAPQPLEALWSRPDLGCVFMCGYAVALGVAPVIPLAAPIPRAAWARGRPVYRSDLIVRADAPYRTLEDTFGGRAGWTVEHSHSGFNAFRHHLLAFRTRERPRLYGAMQGNLVTARAILDGVRDGRLDVGPLDAYWHALIAKHAPELAAGIRVLDSTAIAPLPAFVTAPDTPSDVVERLKLAFAAAASRAGFTSFGDALLIDGFAPVAMADFEPLLDWDRAAQQAGYAVPA